MPRSQRRAAIIAAAVKLLESDGPDFTTRRVAEAAGVAEGTLFRIFPTLADLLAEYQAVRAATLAFFGSLNAGQLDRAGQANGNPFTVRALLYMTAGHEQHHLRLFRERYWPLLAAGPAAQWA